MGKPRKYTNPEEARAAIRESWKRANDRRRKLMSGETFTLVLERSDKELLIAALDYFGTVQGEYARGEAVEANEVVTPYLDDEIRCREIIKLVESK